ncbi:P-loop containing nucleoside triphosphate hydrolase protein [Mycena latifolia]|nr:P-loop containing nucleoside triphosphate hydrolase protein [Mycena latifolia]
MQYFNTGIGRQHIFLLHGLGGCGKSQIAFKFVEQSTSMPHSRFQDVYFVDSSSQQTIENDLMTLALTKKVGKTFQDTLLWLSHQHTEWLIVFNNADDIHLNLMQYFPPGSHGNILITSRNPDLRQLAQATHKVAQMALEEAINLLLSAAQYDIMDDNNRDLGKQIVQKLHWLPLAVAQAGAYISLSGSLEKYLDLYESTTSRIQLLNQRPPQSEYGWSVYATWQISFENVSSQARELLQLCSFIHHDGITEDIFQQAASYKLKPGGPTEVDLHEPLGFLAKFLDRRGSKWDSLKFIALTDELGRFSLIDFQAASGDISFSIHPLVHEWCRAILEADAPTELCMHKLIGMSLSSRGDDFQFSHQMFPHLDALWFKMDLDLSRQPNILDTSFASQCLRVYHEEGKWREGAAELAKMVLNRRRELLGEDHPDTLTTMANLANSYSDMGQFHKAAKLDKVVLNKRREFLSEDHPDTLRAMGNLALRYSQMGQVNEAAELEKFVLTKRKELLGEDHLDTLNAMGNLAIRYARMEKVHEAAELEKVVLSKRKDLLGEDHPDTLRAMGNLAIRYSQLGQSHEAAELQKVVVGKHKNVLGNSHPATLRTMGRLARTYSDMGQFHQAAELEKVVLNKQTELLGEDHPDTLRSLANLGLTCFQIGRLTEARELQELALNACRRVLGEGHPDTVDTAHRLSTTIEQLAIGRPRK